MLAVVVAAPGATPTADGIIEHARARLARYKCPASVEFVESLPRNAAGKVLKRVLRESYRAAAGVPVPEPPAPEPPAPGPAVPGPAGAG